MDSVRFGIVGMGPRGRNGWMRTIKLVPRAEVVAVCDRIEALAKDGAARAEIGPENAYTDLDAMLERRDVDAVGVCVGTEHQTDLAVRALEAGKHVICAVPLCYTLDDCWKLVLAVERSGRKLALEEQLSYAPFVRAWQQMARDGALGKITYAESEYIHGIHLDWYWMDEQTGRHLTFDQARNNPGAVKTRFWNIHHPIWYNPHSLGPLLRILNERVVQVTCMSTRRPGYYLEEVPLPDIEVALMKTEGGTIIRLAMGFVAPAPYPWLWYRLHGTLGEVETSRRSETGVPDGRGSLQWRAGQYTRTRDEINWTFSEHQPAAAAAVQTGHSGLDYYTFEDFVAALVDDRPPLIDVYRAAEIAAPAAVAGTSAEQGSAPLPVPNFRPGPERKAGHAPD